MSCCYRQKPILAGGPVDALRYAWLRAPPSHRANLTNAYRMVLTLKSPYEGGQSDSVPTNTRV